MPEWLRRLLVWVFQLDRRPVEEVDVFEARLRDASETGQWASRYLDG